MNNKQLQIVTFEQAQRLKKMGFDWPTTPYYTFSGLLVDNLPRKEKMANGKYPTFFAPTVTLALKWMRDVKDVRIGFSYGHYRESNIHAMGYAASGFLGDGTGKIIERCPSWESAESALLDELLTLNEK